jgi:hypothetical protein
MIMSKYTKKLGSDNTYKRPKKTHQEQLTADEIAEKLQGYERVDDISEVPINTHVRYFITDENGEQTFRLGGFLQNKNNADKYVYLSNGKVSWVVQVANTIFFRKMSHQEEIDGLTIQYKKKLKEKTELINEYRQIIIDNLGSEYIEKIENKYKPSKSRKIKQIEEKPKKKSGSKAKKQSVGKNKQNLKKKLARR